jgi:hypothetical protein
VSYNVVGLRSVPREKAPCGKLEVSVALAANCGRITGFSVTEIPGRASFRNDDFSGLAETVGPRELVLPIVNILTVRKTHALSSQGSKDNGAGQKTDRQEPQATMPRISFQSDP